MMIARALRAALPAILAGTLGVQVAHADIYTWVDASGAINVSNLAPPDGVRVTKILHASAPETVAREDAARDAARQVEAQALAERVRQLEDEVAFAERQAPPRVDYPPVPAPPVVQYIVEPAPPLMQSVSTAPAYSGCDPTWMGCGSWWTPGFYPASVVVVSVPNFRRFPPVRGGHNFAVRPPMRPFGPPHMPSFTAQLPVLPFGSAPRLKHG
jgi:uncharacterized protein DUF4124